MSPSSRRPASPRSAPSPEAQAVLRALSGTGLSRRSLLAGAGAAGMGALLAACGTKGSSGAASNTASGALRPSAAADRSDTDKVVNWANWTLYLDYDEKSKKYPTLEAFQKQTGLKATYAEDIADNANYFGKIQAQLRLGQDMGKDVIVMTDWMAARLIRQGFVQQFDASRMPNAKNILPTLKDVGFDPGRKSSLTWQSGYAGIAYNKAKVSKPVRTIEDLWRPDLKGKVEVLSEWRDTIGLIMMANGVRIDQPIQKTAFEDALSVLDKQISSGQIRQVKGNDYKDDLKSEAAYAVIGWSGDIFQLNAENGDKWEFVLPESGGTLWSDNMLIPIGSPHKKNAETLINYYYDPKVAAEVAAYVNYICPVQGAREEMLKLDPELAKSPYIFPTEEDLKKVQVFTTLEPAVETDYTKAFEKVLGA